MVAKKKCNKDDIEIALNTIRPLVAANVITAREIENISKIDYPIFSFKYICNYSFDKCKDVSFFKEFLIRLQKLSTLGWKKIALSDRHSFGIEKIDVSQIKPKEKLPPFITDDMKLDVFRATGDNHPFVGIRKGRTFYIFSSKRLLVMYMTMIKHRNTLYFTVQPSHFPRKQYIINKKAALRTAFY